MTNSTTPTTEPSVDISQETTKVSDAPIPTTPAVSAPVVLPPLSAVLDELNLDKMDLDDQPAPTFTNKLGTAIQMLITKRDRISDHISNIVIHGGEVKEMDALMNEVDMLNKRIGVLSATLSSHQEVKTTGLRLTKKDVPKFQLKAQGTSPFPGEETFGTVEQFLRAFEKVMDSTDNDVELVWRKYIPLSLSLDFDAWLRTELLVCNSWVDAKAIFVKTFGNSLLRLQSRRAVMTMRMRGGETVSEYVLRFGRAVADAGYDRLESILGDVFLCGFPESWQVQINTVLASTHHGGSVWSFQDIAAAAQSVFGDRQPGGLTFGAAGTSASKWAHGESSGSGSGAVKRRRVGETSGPSGAASSGSRFFCSRHGGAKANHNEADCYSGKGKGKAPLLWQALDPGTSL